MTKTIDFIGKRKIFFTIALCIIGVALICSFVFGVKMDVQFSGGTIATYSYTGDLSADEVKAAVKDAVGKESSIQEQQDASGNKNVVITVASKLNVDETAGLTKALQEKFADNSLEVMQMNTVDPTIGGEFLAKSLFALLLAAVLIIIYVAIRFRKIGGLSAGVMGVLTLCNDMLVVFAVFVIFRIPLNDNFIAVELMILGYSINDTIIIYDRIRENRRLLGPKVPIRELVNKSITQSFARSINTSVTTALAIGTVCVISLIFNISSIVTFAFPMLIGVAYGAFSSLCICGSLWVSWQEHKVKKVEKAKLENKKSKKK
ncbi:protein translocase subunit SecF [Candidatus Soleaferrea massiliensis]|uniref:protein translocase subunit SecF n=1 Tax=Candidatus Soleaferrea massiliensis TaxID=1470354 RepID=UPI00058EEA9D|nr:protein translocase subunit SecF [Candidatus Soleaferrea massiliensis]